MCVIAASASGDLCTLTKLCKWSKDILFSHLVGTVVQFSELLLLLLSILMIVHKAKIMIVLDK